MLDSAVLGWSSTFLLLCKRQGLGLTVEKTVEVPQLLSSDKVVDILVVAQRQIPMVQSVQKTIEIPQLQYIDKVVDVPGVPVVQILRYRCGGDSRLPQLQLLRNPSGFRTLQYFFVVDVPVVQVHLCVQSWTRSLTCPLLSTTGYCTVEVPQIQLSPVTADIPVVQHRRR